MDVYSVIHNRGSVRKYTQDPVPKEKLTKLLQAAQAAPSWANKQCWRYIVVTNDDKKQQIKGALPEKNPATKAIDQAPIVIVLCADPEESGKAKGREYYLLDAGISMQQLMQAAYAEGLGTCWIAWLEDELKIKEALSIPEDIEIVALTPLGYPAKEPKPTPRKELTEFVYEDEWAKEINLPSSH